MKRRPLSRKLQESFLSSVVEFMVRVGVPEQEIRASLESAIVRAKRMKRDFHREGKEARYRGDGDVSAYLLRLWNRDHRLVDSISLAPRPLPLLKGKNNLRSMVAALDPNVDPLKVLKAMKAARLIRHVSRGRYVPADDGAIFSSLHPWAIEHTAKSVIRLVSTVYRNAGVSSGEPRLLERYSYVPDLDPANRSAFAEFARTQGLNYLQAVDDWLERRRVRKLSGARKKPSGIAAGVHLITYLDETVSTRMERKPKASVRREAIDCSRLDAVNARPSAPA